MAEGAPVESVTVQGVSAQRTLAGRFGLTMTGDAKPPDVFSCSVKAAGAVVVRTDAEAGEIASE